MVSFGFVRESGRAYRMSELARLGFSFDWRLTPLVHLPN